MNKIYLISALAAASLNAVAGDSVVANKALVDSSYRAGATSIHYLSYAASTMTSIRSGKDFSYGGGGCLQASSTGTYFEHKVDLPDGSQIVSISFNGFDNNNSEQFGVEFSRYPMNGSFTNLLSANGIDQGSGISATPGRVNLGGFFNPPITVSSASALSVRMRPGPSTSGDVEVCNVRIGYIPPDVTDVIFASDFYR